MKKKEGTMDYIHFRIRTEEKKTIAGQRAKVSFSVTNTYVYYIDSFHKNATLIHVK